MRRHNPVRHDPVCPGCATCPGRAEIRLEGRRRDRRNLLRSRREVAADTEIVEPETVGRDDLFRAAHLAELALKSQCGFGGCVSRIATEPAFLSEAAQRFGIVPRLYDFLRCTDLDET